MKTHKTITKLIALTLTLAALFAGGLLQPIKAQTGDGSVRFGSYASTGIINGEKLRLSVANTAKSGGSLSYSFSYYLAHGTNASSSVPLYESEWIKVPSGEFRSSDVSREDLKIDGEPETGRAEVIVKVTIIAPAGSSADDSTASLEIIPNEAQGAVETDSKYRLILVAAQRCKQVQVPIGIMAGERLRYSFFYPNEEGDQPVSVSTYIYDSYGNLLKQTDPVVLRPGDGHVVDINRDDLRVPGEGRLQVRPSIQTVLMDGSVRPVKLSLSMEVVKRSGSSSGGSYYTGTVTVSGDG